MRDSEGLILAGEGRITAGEGRIVSGQGRIAASEGRIPPSEGHVPTHPTHKKAGTQQTCCVPVFLIRNAYPYDSVSLPQAFSFPPPDVLIHARSIYK